MRLSQHQLSKKTIDQLFAMKYELDVQISEIYKVILNKEREVTMTKIKSGTTRFEFEGRMWEAVKDIKGRFRIFKMTRGAKPGTVKRGAVAKKEFTGTVVEIRSAIASGAIK